jgi:DNA-binding NarL/FixJ family response regulator
VIRVLVAGDHDVVRKGLCALLKYEEGIEVVAEARDGVEAVRMAMNFIPDVILLDLLMPRLSGVEAIVQIRQEVPHARVLVLANAVDDSADEAVDDSMLFAAIKAGIESYVPKVASTTELVQAIQNAFHGQPSLHPTLARELVRALKRSGQLFGGESLTGREGEVLFLIARGLAVRDIAHRLIVSEATVHRLINSILKKVPHLLGPRGG